MYLENVKTETWCGSMMLGALVVQERGAGDHAPAGADKRVLPYFAADWLADRDDTISIRLPLGTDDAAAPACFPGTWSLGRARIFTVARAGDWGFCENERSL
jgi:hypothetical protein